MPYESIHKPGDPDFVPDSAGGLGGGIGSHTGHRMAYDACIFRRSQKLIGHKFLVLTYTYCRCMIVQFLQRKYTQ